MKWLAASLIVLAFSAGCHAPKPSFNPLAAYGSSRVPPPATNSTARNAPYYNQPGGPAGSAPAATTNPTSGQGSDAAPSLSNPSLTSSQDIWKSVAMRSAQAGNQSGCTRGQRRRIGVVQLAVLARPILGRRSGIVRAGCWFQSHRFLAASSDHGASKHGRQHRQGQ
jgi:hypothetical protein